MPVDKRTKATHIPENDSGPFLATVVSHLDPKGMGALQVQIERPVGGDRDETNQLTTCRYLSPFYGVTDFRHNGSNNEYADTQKSYGMWFIPPDIGTKVLVVFAGGSSNNAFWIGCVQDEYMNHMIPGIAASSFHVDGSATKVPVAEFNKKTQDGSQFDATKIKKPAHPMQGVLDGQGLLEDETRGITTSSARREVPSMVFGISTPGPVDKKGKRGRIGKAGNKVPTAFVSRLGGSTFVMDDGDDKFVRKTPASEGKSEYVAVEAGEKGGDVHIPHNELIRLRTRTGHQILLHNSEDLIYIGNAKGTSWIEMTSNGKIDIYAKDSISIHTENDMNFRADRDINIEAGRNINMKAVGVEDFGDPTAGETGRIQMEAAGNYNLIVGNDGKITVGNDFDLFTENNNKFTAAFGATDILSGSNHTETASEIHMNGPQAAEAVEAEALSTHILTSDSLLNTVNSIMKRMPTVEPWKNHENLGPEESNKIATDRELPTPVVQGEQISIVDTFKKVPPTEG